MSNFHKFHRMNTKEYQEEIKNIQNNLSPDRRMLSDSFTEDSNLEKGLKGDWQKEGYRLVYNKDPNEDVLHHITAYAPDNKIAGRYSFVFHGKDTNIYPYDSMTHDEHKRKGLANTAYKLIENKLNSKVMSSSDQSKDAKALWSQANRPFGKEELEKMSKGFAEIYELLAKAKSNILYIATDGDNIGASVERAAMSNDIKEIKKQDAIIKKGNQTIRKWIKKRKGSIYIDGGDDISFTMHKKYLPELEEMRKQYHDATGYTLTVGVGSNISEAAHAMVYGKLKGKNQINEWTEEIEKIVSQNDEKPKTAEEKYAQEGLVGKK